MQQSWSPVSPLPHRLGAATGRIRVAPSSLFPLGLLAWIWGNTQESRSLLGGGEHYGVRRSGSGPAQPGRDVLADRETPRSTGHAFVDSRPPLSCSSCFLQAAGKFREMPGVLLTIRAQQLEAGGHPTRCRAPVSQEGGPEFCVDPPLPRAAPTGRAARFAR